MRTEEDDHRAPATAPPAPEEGFGELRSLLQGAPDPARWQALCARLEALSPPELERALPYAEGHLRAWPDAMRAAPGRWLHRALDDETTWAARGPWQVVRAVRLERRARWRGDPEPLGRLLRPEVCGHLTRLTLEGFGVTHAHAPALGDPAVVGHLSHLSLHRAALDARGWRALTTSRALGALTALRLTDAPLSLERARDLRRAPWLPRLRALDLSRADVNAQRLDTILAGVDTDARLGALIVRGHLLGGELGYGLERLRAGAITSLDLSSATVPPDALTSWLREGARLPHLRALELSYTTLSPDALAPLRDPARLPALEVLGALGFVWAPRHAALLDALARSRTRLRRVHLQGDEEALRHAAPALTVSPTPMPEDEAHELW